MECGRWEQEGRRTLRDDRRLMRNGGGDAITRVMCSDDLMQRMRHIFYGTRGA
jgi:heat shock protein HslJ